VPGIWKLEGTELGDADTDIVVTTTDRAASISVPTEEVYGDTEVWERAGKKLRVVQVTFSIKGRGEVKFDWDTRIMDILENNTAVLLESSQYDDNYRVHDVYRRIYMQPQGRISSRIVNASLIEVSFTAIILGVPVADGGDYCIPTTGSFTLQSTGPNVWVRDDGVNTGSLPLLDLPLQETGYPKAVQGSAPFAEGTPPLVSTYTASDPYFGTVTYGRYNMTGFLIPTPSAAGDVGLFQACSAPTVALLDAVLESLTTESDELLLTELGESILV
jgi:hypothetical protein